MSVHFELSLLKETQVKMLELYFYQPVFLSLRNWDSTGLCASIGFSSFPNAEKHLTFD